MSKLLFSNNKSPNLLKTNYNEDGSWKASVYYNSCLIASGVTGYKTEDDSVFIPEEVLDSFARGFTGVPVCIDHKDVIKDEDIVGYCSLAFVEGNKVAGHILIKDKSADEMIQNGYEFSSSWTLKDEFSNFVKGRAHNGVKYGIEILSPKNNDDLVAICNHIAIVSTGRYESQKITKLNTADNMSSVETKTEKGESKNEMVSMPTSFFDRLFSRIKNNESDEKDNEAPLTEQKVREIFEEMIKSVKHEDKANEDEKDNEDDVQENNESDKVNEDSKRRDNFLQRKKLSAETDREILHQSSKNKKSPYIEKYADNNDNFNF